MKRMNRRLHLLIWIFLFPITALFGVWAWMQRPAEVTSSFPDDLETIERNLERNLKDDIQHNLEG